MALRHVHVHPGRIARSLAPQLRRRGVAVAAGLAGVTLVLGFSVGRGVVFAGSTSAGHGHDRDDVLVGTVATVGTSSFIVSGLDGTTYTVNTTAATTYAETGTPVAPSGVSAGDLVSVRALDADGDSDSESTSSTVTASWVLIVLQRVAGEVSNVSGSTITLSAQRGGTRTVDVSSATQYFEDGAAVSFSAVSPGARVIGFGTFTGGVLDAQFVDVIDKAESATEHDPDDSKSAATLTASTTAAGKKEEIFGTVQSVGGNSFVVTTRDGVESVLVTSSTVFKKGDQTVSLTSIAPGDKVKVEGAVDSATEITAAAVQIGGGCDGDGSGFDAGPDPRGGWGGGAHHDQNGSHGDGGNHRH